eukprot:TRINITY_DN3082_c0_g2_i1.p1 TRINITY_DN3082_c0_g2~~TRINITY_DN3082_c0_g2_i1.p1  ORF type:complete len:233 (-),score=53.50 TRINITY_DN3082_c0_g2_i1:113-811(-)
MCIRDSGSMVKTKNALTLFENEFKSRQGKQIDLTDGYRVNIARSTFLGGKGISITDASLSLSECIVQKAKGASALSFSSFGAPLSIKQCSFKGNEADNGGALTIRVLGTPNITIDTSSFSGNKAKALGGAIFVAAGEKSGASSGIMLVNACAFEGNSAGTSGAAVYAENQPFVYQSIKLEKNTSPKDEIFPPQKRLLQVDSRDQFFIPRVSPSIEECNDQFLYWLYGCSGLS